MCVTKRRNSVITSRQANHAARATNGNPPARPRHMCVTKRRNSVKTSRQASHAARATNGSPPTRPLYMHFTSTPQCLWVSLVKVNTHITPYPVPPMHQPQTRQHSTHAVVCTVILIPNHASLCRTNKQHQNALGHKGKKQQRHRTHQPPRRRNANLVPERQHSNQPPSTPTPHQQDTPASSEKPLCRRKCKDFKSGTCCSQVRF